MSDAEVQSYALKYYGPQHSIYMPIRGKGYNYIYVPPDYYLNVPCGTCFSCIKNRQREFNIRLLYELDSHKYSVFVTLTLDDDNLLKFKDDYKKPFKLYIDRLRKEIGFRPRYWFITEYGDDVNHTGRLHFHGFFFGVDKETFDYNTMRFKWPYGYSWIKKVERKHATYVTKYVGKQFGEKKSFIMSSNGIGASYISNFDKVRDWHLNDFEPRNYIWRFGKKWPLGQYYRLKLFNDDIRHVLSLNRYLSPVDKVKYLNGVKYTDVYSYEKARISYLQLTKQLKFL